MTPVKPLIGLALAMGTLSAQDAPPTFVKYLNSDSRIIEFDPAQKEQVYTVDLTQYFDHYENTTGPVLTMEMSLPKLDSSGLESYLLTRVIRKDGVIDKLDLNRTTSNPIDPWQPYQLKEGLDWNYHLYREIPDAGGFEIWPMDSFVHETFTVNIQTFPREAPNEVAILLNAVLNDEFDKTIVHEKSEADAANRYMTLGKYRHYYPGTESAEELQFEPYPESFLTTATLTGVLPSEFPLSPTAGTICLERDSFTGGAPARPWLIVNLTDNEDIFSPSFFNSGRPVVGELQGEGALAPFEQIDRAGVYNFQTLMGTTDFFQTPLYLPDYLGREYYPTIDRIFLDPALNTTTSGTVTYQIEEESISNAENYEKYYHQPATIDAATGTLTLTRKIPEDDPETTERNESEDLGTGSFNLPIRLTSTTDGDRSYLIVVRFDSGNPDVISYFRESSDSFGILENGFYNLSWFGDFYEKPLTMTRFIRPGGVTTGEDGSLQQLTKPQEILGGWIWHEELEWMYVEFARLSAERTSSFVMMFYPELVEALSTPIKNPDGTTTIPEVSDPWFYTNRRFYPFIYSYGTGDWLFYLEGSGPTALIDQSDAETPPEGAVRWIYDYSSGRYLSY